jgi:repressor LexA
MLTTKQKELFEFIKGFIKKNSYSPTHKEMRGVLGINSSSYLDRLLDKLESMELIRRKAGGTRYNIELLQSPYTLPILGRIAAGSPIETIEEPEELALIDEVVGENRYLLRVKGDSMIDENICDGDLVICEHCQKVPDGTIVVALVDKNKATLKRIYYKEGKVHLQPSNVNHKTQVYELNEVEIQGKFIGLFRLAT